MWLPGILQTGVVSRAWSLASVAASKIRASSLMPLSCLDGLYFKIFKIWFFRSKPLSIVSLLFVTSLICNEIAVNILGFWETGGLTLSSLNSKKFFKNIFACYRLLQIMIATLLIKASINKRFVICHGLLLTYRLNAEFHQCHKQGEMCLDPSWYSVHYFSIFTAHCTKAMTTHIREFGRHWHTEGLSLWRLSIGHYATTEASHWISVVGLPLNIITCIFLQHATARTAHNSASCWLLASHRPEPA